VKEANEDQKQFYKDLGATTEQTVQEVRGLEENCYGLVQGAMIALPWAVDFNKKMQKYIEQNFDAAFAFARELSEANDARDVFRIYSDDNQKCLQSITAQVKDVAQTYSDMASGVISAPSLTPRE
jgi:Phasin protein